MTPEDFTPDVEYPLALFRFQAEFTRVSAPGEGPGAPVAICRGAFSECTGLEATMEPKVIKAGGANYGPFQRVGPVTFGTVILKRGITTSRDLWKWFSHLTEQGRSAFRLDVKITVLGTTQLPAAPGEPDRDEAPEAALTFQLTRAMPVKFKAGDLSARATEVGIEELHLAHEGLSLS